MFCLPLARAERLRGSAVPDVRFNVPYYTIRCLLLALFVRRRLLLRQEHFESRRCSVSLRSELEPLPGPRERAATASGSRQPAIPYPPTEVAIITCIWFSLKLLYAAALGPQVSIICASSTRSRPQRLAL